MNSRGQVTVGAIIIAAVAIIAALAMMSGGVTNSVGLMTQTVTVTNATEAAGAAGSTFTLDGQAARSFIAINATDGLLIPATNYTVNNYVVSNGALISTVSVKAGPYINGNWNVSYVSEPFGYDTSSGNRAVINLVLIFAFLAVAVIALTPALNSGIVEFFGK